MTFDSNQKWLLYDKAFEAFRLNDRVICQEHGSTQLRKQTVNIFLDEAHGKVFTDSNGLLVSNEEA